MKLLECKSRSYPERIWEFNERVDDVNGVLRESYRRDFLVFCTRLMDDPEVASL